MKTKSRELLLDIIHDAPINNGKTILDTEDIIILDGDNEIMKVYDYKVIDGKLFIWTGSNENTH